MRVGNRNNTRNRMLPNGAYYTLGTLKYYKYTGGVNQSGFKTLTDVHEEIARGNVVYEYDKQMCTWAVLNRITGKWDKI